MPAPSGTCGLDEARRLGELLRAVSARLSDAGIESARLDARLLIAEAARVRTEDILLNPDQAVAQSEIDVLEGLVARRETREPIAHILGIKGFRNFDLEVSSDVLVPRPETEVLVDVAEQFLVGRKQAGMRILDLGTGSGCIILSLMDSFPNAEGIAVDVSDSALSVARSNADALSLSDRIVFRRGHWFEPLDIGEADFDLIVSNPPYIPTADVRNLEPDAREHEPVLALDGGGDGLNAYREIVPNALKRLLPDGALIVEIGIHQDSDVVALCRTAGFANVSVVNDLAGVPRVVVAIRSET